MTDETKQELMSTAQRIADPFAREVIMALLSQSPPRPTPEDGIDWEIEMADFRRAIRNAIWPYYPNNPMSGNDEFIKVIGEMAQRLKDESPYRHDPPTPGREEGERWMEPWGTDAICPKSACGLLITQHGEWTWKEHMAYATVPSPSQPQQAEQGECEHNFQVMRHNYDFERCIKGCGAFKFRDVILVPQEQAHAG